MGCGQSKDPSVIGVAHEDVDPGWGTKKPQNGGDAVKMLLLGAGESGKSTIFKQMRILHGKPRDDAERATFAIVIRSNVVTAARQLANSLRMLGLEEELASEEEREAYEEILTNIVDVSKAALLKNGSGQPMSNAYAPPGAENMQQGYYKTKAGEVACREAELFSEYWKMIETLWKSDVIQQSVWPKRATANIIDGHKKFLDEIETIADSGFVPGDEDILLARVRTTDATVEKYHIQGVDFEIKDVGGQRAERKKWIESWESVDAVIFVAALSEYDQSLNEARRTNRMVEAIELFRSVCNNRQFADKPVLLFLNKKDIFMEKILYSDIGLQAPFRDFQGPAKDFDAGVNYFKLKFEDCINDPEHQDSFIHVTEATDTENMEFVLESSRTIILQDVSFIVYSPCVFSLLTAFGICRILSDRVFWVRIILLLARI